MHVHLAMPSIAVQIAFLPQGDNRQGSYGSVGRAAIIFINDYLKLFKILLLVITLFKIIIVENCKKLQFNIIR